MASKWFYMILALAIFHASCEFPTYVFPESEDAHLQDGGENRDEVAAGFPLNEPQQSKSDQHVHPKTDQQESVKNDATQELPSNPKQSPLNTQSNSDTKREGKALNPQPVKEEKESETLERETLKEPASNPGQKNVDCETVKQPASNLEPKSKPETGQPKPEQTKAKPSNPQRPSEGEKDSKTPSQDKKEAIPKNTKPAVPPTNREASRVKKTESKVQQPTGQVEKQPKNVKDESQSADKKSVENLQSKGEQSSVEPIERKAEQEKASPLNQEQRNTADKLKETPNIENKGEYNKNVHPGNIEQAPTGNKEGISEQNPDTSDAAKPELKRNKRTIFVRSFPGPFLPGPLVPGPPIFIGPPPLSIGRVGIAVPAPFPGIMGGPTFLQGQAPYGGIGVGVAGPFFP